MGFLSVPISISSIFGLNKRMIGSIEVDVVMQESTNDTLTITKQPVQQGASVTDHSFKEPTALSMVIYFRDNVSTSLSEVYQQLIDLQSSRAPITVTTPKRTYDNMLISSLGQTTDKTTENCLSITLSFQEVIFVPVTTTTVPRQKQKFPGVTGAIQNAGRKSALQAIKEGVGGFFK
jgi:hypothetical protein